MYSIDDYVRWAKEETGISSSNALSFHLKMSRPTVGLWLKRKSIPSDEAMIKLAIAGKRDVDEALLYLAFWRTASRDEANAAQRFKMMLDQFFPQAA